MSKGKSTARLSELSDNMKLAARRPARSPDMTRPCAGNEMRQIETDEHTHTHTQGEKNTQINTNN